ncbi:MAG: hypothetical protein M0C28_27040 [Candidatus Moduliflexus flocculans]|nr:hypothetical protein [Candidatus Moduliflexus flocculans]
MTIPYEFLQGQPSRRAIAWSRSRTPKAHPLGRGRGRRGPGHQGQRPGPSSSRSGRPRSIAKKIAGIRVQEAATSPSPWTDTSSGPPTTPSSAAASG